MLGEVVDLPKSIIKNRNRNIFYSKYLKSRRSMNIQGNFSNTSQ